MKDYLLKLQYNSVNITYTVTIYYGFLVRHLHQLYIPLVVNKRFN